MGDVNKHREIGKYISILQRLSNIYFANELSSYQIGCGQQFFLLQIFKNPGISLQELASNGSYDKATATRAVKKLEEEGVQITEVDLAPFKESTASYLQNFITDNNLQEVFDKIQSLK